MTDTVPGEVSFTTYTMSVNGSTATSVGTFPTDIVVVVPPPTASTPLGTGSDPAVIAWDELAGALAKSARPGTEAQPNPSPIATVATPTRIPVRFPSIRTLTPS
jgi:hypothetical protein